MNRSEASVVRGPRDVRARRVLQVVFATVFLDLIGFGIIIPLLPLYVQKMGGNARTVGFILGSFSFTQLVATPILGGASDRMGRRPIVLFSLAGNAISMAVFAAATEIGWLPLLFVSRIVAGATAGNLSACQAAIADVTDERDRSRAMGTVGAGIGLGLVLGPVLGSTLSALGGWAPPLAAALLATVDLIAAAIVLPETNPRAGARDEGSPTHASSSYAQRMRQAVNRDLGLLLAIFFFSFLAITNLQVSLPLLVARRFSWAETQVGRLFAFYGVIALLTQAFLIGKLTKAWGQKPVVLVGSVCTAAGMWLIAQASGTAMMLLAVGLVAFGFGVVNPVLSGLASTVAAPGRRGGALGLLQSSGGLARTVGPVLSGYLFTGGGAKAPFIGGALAAGLASCVGLLLPHVETKGARPSSG